MIDGQVGLILLCSKIFLLCFLEFLFFLAYYSQNYAHNSYYSPINAHIFTRNNNNRFMHVNPILEIKTLFLDYVAVLLKQWIVLLK